MTYFLLWRKIKRSKDRELRREPIFSWSSPGRPLWGGDSWHWNMLGRSEGISHWGISRKSVPGRGNGQCKGSQTMALGSEWWEGHRNWGQRDQGPDPRAYTVRWETTKASQPWSETSTAAQRGGGRGQPGGPRAWGGGCCCLPGRTRLPTRTWKIVLHKLLYARAIQGTVKGIGTWRPEVRVEPLKLEVFVSMMIMGVVVRGCLFSTISMYFCN